LHICTAKHSTEVTQVTTVYINITDTSQTTHLLNVSEIYHLFNTENNLTLNTARIIVAKMTRIQLKLKVKWFLLGKQQLAKHDYKNAQMI